MLLALAAAALLVAPYTTALPRPNNALITPRAGLKILQGNDDGWGHANIRALYAALKAAGYDSVISAPANNLSGAGSLDFPPIPLISAGEFDLLPIGAPATGADPTDDHINYVNSFPVTAIKNGLSETALKLFGGKPDLVVTGPNGGSNLGLVTQFSGTVGAANEAVSQGIPAVAFSGAVETFRSFKELAAGDYSDVYAQLSLKVIDTLTAGGKPYLPAGVGLNVNFPTSDASTCSTAGSFIFIQSRINVDINPLTPDVDACGTTHLPTESDVQVSGKCAVSVSAFKQGTKLDVDAATQKVIRDKLASLLTCL